MEVGIDDKLLANLMTTLEAQNQDLDSRESRTHQFSLPLGRHAMDITVSIVFKGVFGSLLPDSADVTRAAQELLDLEEGAEAQPTPKHYLEVALEALGGRKAN